MSRPLRVVVVGGGIAGLAAAHRLVETGRAGGPAPALTLVEAAGRLGGNIRTERIDGFLVEAGPDSFLTDKPAGLALVERLGLGARVRGVEARARQTWVLHRGRLHAFPEGFLLLAPTRLGPLLRSSLFSWRGKARMGLDLVLPRGAPDGDESLAAFVTRRLGREALDRVVAPLIGGIHATDPRRLSVAATLPRLRALERDHRSLILGLRRSRPPAAPGAGRRPGPFATLAGGMQELVDALADRLAPGTARLGAPVAEVARDGADAAWSVRLDGGARLPADAVVLAGEAHRTAGLVAGLDPELGRRLQAIPYASSATVSLAYPRAAIGHPLDGTGFVVAEGEPVRVRACTFSSVKYAGRAPEGWVLLRAFLGGAGDPAAVEMDGAELVRLAHRDLAGLLGIRAAPSLSRVARHRQVLPRYEIGHLERVAAIEARLAAFPGLWLAGSAYGGVGLADTIRLAEQVADRLRAGPTGTPGAAGDATGG